MQWNKNNSENDEIPISKISKLWKEKNAIILVHYYPISEIQETVDLVGDSLDLSRDSAETKAEMIIFARVYLMTESTKILSPEKRVFNPNINAGCSLVESCTTTELKEFREKYSNQIGVFYVNTTSEIKAMTEVTCTSTNAVRKIESIPKDQKIIFAPDRNLGKCLNSITGSSMLLWDDACHVHEEFSLDKMLAILKKHPKARSIAHPECQRPVPIAADFVVSISSLLKFTLTDSGNEYVAATKSSIIHQMRKRDPTKHLVIKYEEVD